MRKSSRKPRRLTIVAWLIPLLAIDLLGIWVRFSLEGLCWGFAEGASSFISCEPGIIPIGTKYVLAASGGVALAVAAKEIVAPRNRESRDTILLVAMMAQVGLCFLIARGIAIS